VDSLKALVASSLLVVVGACSQGTAENSTTTTTTHSTVPHHTEIKLVAVGDISCGTSQRASGSYPCRDKEVAQVAQSQDADYALLLGDIQYPTHDIADYYANFKPNWSQVDAKFIPVLGNHEYDSNVEEGFYAVWGAQVPRTGYYTVEIGIGWFVIVLDSNRVTDEQYQWFSNQLTKYNDSCVIVAMHHPRYSSGVHGNNSEVSGLYDLMVQNDVVAVLTGHDHHYERFDGPVPQYVVGTGGKDLRSISGERSSVTAFNDKHGVLSISIVDTTFRSYFVDITGATYDGYSTECD
jgi:hypothetical protein